MNRRCSRVGGEEHPEELSSDDDPFIGVARDGCLVEISLREIHVTHEFLKPGIATQGIPIPSDPQVSHGSLAILISDTKKCDRIVGVSRMGVKPGYANRGHVVVLCARRKNIGSVPHASAIT
ncbi:MAG TPA: hypothetical protein VMH81_27405, partial [Bryobacteraceae bacterium]|nr:hypothetical protein [Bryobacteraceae bacterium]